MKLSELIDLEVQLLRDERGEGDGAEDPIARDRAIGLRIADELGHSPEEVQRELHSSRKLRHRIASTWLRELPGAIRATLPGSRIVGGYHIAGWILLAVCFAAGIGTALTALHGTDEQPINVLVFIVIFFLLQILLLALYPILLLIRKLRGGRILPWVQSLLVRISRLRWLSRRIGDRIGELPESLQQIRVRHSVYSRVQDWTLFALVQRLGTAFNLAALLATLGMVTLTDLAFCWSTTLSIEAADLHRWLGWIATPWSFVDSAGAPSLDAIHYSRWVTSGDSGYLPVLDESVDAPALRRTWWRFLIAGLITWGLLPRALAWAAGSCFARRTGDRVPLTHMQVQHLFERLFPPMTDWSGPAPEDVRGAAPTLPDRPVLPAPESNPAVPGYLVCWGTLFAVADQAAAHLTRRFHRHIRGVFGAGLADIGVEHRTLDALRKAKAQRVTLALPEGQQPTKDVMRFLAELRHALGAQCELVVGLLAEDGGAFADVDGDERETWRRRLLAEADPYLSVQGPGTTR